MTKLSKVVNLRHGSKAQSRKKEEKIPQSEGGSGGLCFATTMDRYGIYLGKGGGGKADRCMTFLTAGKQRIVYQYQP